VVLVAAAVVVMLMALAGPAVHQDSVRLLIPLLACISIVVLRRWPLPVLGVVTVAAGLVTASGSASLPFGVLLGLALYFPHAPGARAVVELTVSAGKVRLDVRDDGGPGGAVPRAGLAGGHGIAGMRERIGAFGGWLAAGPAAGGGFQVTAEAPAEGAAS
jgi:hypothetical protein